MLGWIKNRAKRLLHLHAAGKYLNKLSHFPSALKKKEKKAKKKKRMGWYRVSMGEEEGAKKSLLEVLFQS